MKINIQRVLKSIDLKTVAQVAYDLVDVASETGNEHSVVDRYAALLKDFGLDVQMQPVDQWGRSNVIGKVRGNGQSSRSLMLNGHLDTIPWGNCIKPRIDWDTNQVFGRGACDMKGALAAAAITGKALVESDIDLSGSLYIVGVVGEEGGLLNPQGERWQNGTKALLESGFTTTAAIVMEGNPPDRPAIACKSNMRFEITVVGAERIIHETQRPLHLNPLFWQAEVVQELGRLNQQLSRISHPLVGHPTVNLGRVVGADFSNPQHNTVPTTCFISGLRRVIPGETADDVKKEFSKLLHTVNKKSLLSIQLALKGDPTPWEIPPNEPIVKSLQKGIQTVTGVEPAPTGGAIQSDAVWLNRGTTKWHQKFNRKGITAPCYGPSQPGIHSDKESVNIKELVTAAQIYLMTALDFCGGIP